MYKHHGDASSSQDYIAPLTAPRRDRKVAARFCFCLTAAFVVATQKKLKVVSWDMLRWGADAGQLSKNMSESE